jgi:RHS repeat-associated protein
MGGGGGGGSSYIAVTASLTNTSTVAGVNSGDGYLAITAITPITNLNQYYLASTTVLNQGSSTNLGGVTFGATLNSDASTTLQLQVEVEPAGTNFTNVPNVTSSPSVSPGNTATTSFYGLSGITQGYHWQARSTNASGTNSLWQIFGSSATSTDFLLNNTLTYSYTGSVVSITTPAHAIQFQITAYGGQGGSSVSSGGLGGQASGTLAVTSGTVYYISVGQAGGNGNSSGSGSFSGGGGGGITWFSTSSTFATSSVLIVAGGGGKGGDWSSTSGGSVSGGTGGYGGGGNGGNTNGSAAGAGGGGGGYWGGFGGNSNSGGNAGTQTSGYAQGQGGAGINSQGLNCSGGSGGSGGGTSGNNGSVTTCNGFPGDGGGGGGSAFISTSTALTNTSTLVGQNSGNGSLILSEVYDPVPVLTSSTQYRPDGVTVLNLGSSTNKTPVVFSAVLNSWIGRELQLQVEVEPTSTTFTNTPNVTSSVYVTPGSVATTSFYGANGSYHWQARAIDVLNNTSTWQRFGPTSTSTDFVIAVPHINFTFPTQGTTTQNFANWQLKADTVTSTDSYSLTVNWDDTTGSPAQTSTINASGTQLLAGVNVPKPTSSMDYTLDAVPVLINATATLLDNSTTSATSSLQFTEVTTSTAVSCISKTIQCISYRYDNVGNITQVIDNSATAAAITVSYAYDGLNRLISASSSNASSGVNYAYTYSYDPVGNLLSGSAGTYTYAGSGYPNPDAATKIVNGTSTLTYGYDQNGNLTNVSSTASYTWDYLNRLTASSSTSATSTYGYDYTSQRVKLVSSTATTYYPETTYNVNGSTKTKHVFANGVLVATVANATSTSPGLSVVQVKESYSGASPPVTSSTISISTTAGNLLVLWESQGTSTTANATPTDSAGNTWNLVATSTRGAGNDEESLYYAYNALSIATATCKFSTSTIRATCMVWEISGAVANSGVLDASVTIASTTSVTNLESGKLTTANANDILLYGVRSGTDQTSFTAATSYSFPNNATDTRVAIEDRVVTSTLTNGTTTITSGAAGGYVGIFAAFKAALSTATTTSISYTSVDMLGGSNVVTNSSGTVVETLQYFPYGKIRIDNTAGSFSGEVRKYIGQEYDAATALSYLNARYYEGNRGQFLSQDPIFVSGPQSQNLSDPQSLNAYSYSEDNPIIKSDPTGKCAEDLCIGEIALTEIGIQFLRSYLVNLGIGLYLASNGNAVPSNISQPSQVNSNSTVAVSPYLSTPFTAQDYSNVAKEQILPSLAGPVGGELAYSQFGIKKIIGSAAGIGVSSLLQGEGIRPVAPEE